jgi:hypothetical protein
MIAVHDQHDMFLYTELAEVEFSMDRVSLC